MKAWDLHPIIYEINTWIWLSELSKKYKRKIDLATVPEEEWNSIASWGFDTVWFMGVWERSAASTEVSMHNQALIKEFYQTLPDFTSKDNIGSAYAVRRYVVDEHLGGPKGLSLARQQLSIRNIKMILDFVPNHVALDHPWVSEHPEYFIQGNVEEFKKDPLSFNKSGKYILAHGRDPYFPPWSDVFQLNAFNLDLRKAVIETISEIAKQCDGIRCDMAMLMLNHIFEKTWGNLAGNQPKEDYWITIIKAIKTNRSDFKFIAEAYWDLEWELQQQGFDFCYDKTLYDRMAYANAENIRRHLLADLSYQQKMVRFIENHDEPRATVIFPNDKERAAALMILTLPGATLLHEGQFEGLKIKLPVFLARRTAEPINQELESFYKYLLHETTCEVFKNGNWSLCEQHGWPDNQSCKNILTWCWKKDEKRYLIIINFSNQTSQALITTPWDEIRGKMWRLHDPLANTSYDRSGNDMRDNGLFIELEAWKFHFFQLKLI